MEISKLTLAKEILDKEFSDSLKERYGTWEYHELAMICGEIKHLIENLNNPIKLKRNNHNYKLILQGKL